MFTFIKWIWNLFPDYWHNTDTNVNLDDEGLWERYCNIFEIELDSNFYAFIPLVLDFFNAFNFDTKYLQYAAYNAGDMQLTSITQIDQPLVAWACSLYKVKGAYPGFQMIFNILGFPNIEIIEHYPNAQITYDDGITLYDGDNNPIYDTICPPCTTYDILYDNSGTIINFIEPQWAIIQSLVCSIQAIDAKLGNMLPVFPSPIDNIDASDWVDSTDIELTTVATPTGLTVNSSANNIRIVTWTIAGGISSWNLRWKPQNQNFWNYSPLPMGTTTSFAITALGNPYPPGGYQAILPIGSRYQIELRAVASAVKSAWTPLVNFDTFLPCPTLINTFTIPDGTHPEKVLFDFAFNCFGSLIFPIITLEWKKSTDAIYTQVPYNRDNTSLLLTLPGPGTYTFKMSSQCTDISPTITASPISTYTF